VSALHGPGSARIGGDAGLLIDRSRPVTFRFEGRPVRGFEGDTIASALVADGRWLMSRSFKYHRPRGPVSFAGHEANTLVQLGAEPNVPADLRRVSEGDDVRPLNVFGSLRHDRGALLGRLSRFLPVGFYYRTFFGTDGAWDRWEPAIRALSGLGRVGVPDARGPRFDKQFVHCDVAVVGGGPAGLAAAAAAAADGADVALFEQLPVVGGSLLYARLHADPATDARLRAEWRGALQPRAGVRVFASASCTGIFEDGLLSVVTGSRLLKVRAQRVVLAHGGIEQCPVFPDNDLPGVALCSGLQRLIRLYGVRPGRQAVVVASDDAGYGAALDLIDAGTAVAALVDLRGRGAAAAELLDALERAGVRIVDGVHRLEAHAAPGGLHLAGVTIGTGAGRTTRLECDVLAVSAGTVPSHGLAAQAGAAVRYDASVRNLVVGECPASIFAVGLLAGRTDLEDLVAHASDAGLRAARIAGDGDDAGGAPVVRAAPPMRVLPAWPIFESGRGKPFVDMDEDLVPDDLREAVRLGYAHMQLLKRFSTVGMGPSQGRHSALATLRILARETGSEHASVGLATARPPAGEETVAHLAGHVDDALRLTSTHEAHLARGAVMMPAGAWLRPAYFGSPASRERHIDDEVEAVRTRAGVFDVGTLGGLLVRGPDAAAFLERIYTGRFLSMKPGMVRYALMLDETGTVTDDGVAARLEPDEFYVTTTTGHSDSVYRGMLRWNARWRMDLDVTNVTSALCGLNLAGPQSRAVLARLCPGADLSAEGFGYMRARVLDVAGAQAIVMRVGFLGELSYEVHVPSSRAADVLALMLEAGRPEGIVPVGIEAQRLLRLEKGHVIVGQDTDGVSTPAEVGMGWAVAADKPFFVGQRALVARARKPAERALVCWQAAPGVAVPVAEGHLVLSGDAIAGHVTSVGRSAALGRTIGMAFAPAASAAPGSRIVIKGERGERVEVEVVEPPFYDPKGARQKA
jgi:sarcosine oxidase subunit alpha